MNIKILVCYHKPAHLLKDDILTPIHVGRELALKQPDSKEKEWLLKNCIGDNTGKNISAKNSSYNEMTSLYWAWKNYDSLGNPDYIGMMHYRRHFFFSEEGMGEYSFDEFDEKYYYKQIGYSPEKLEELLSKNDYVVHMGRVDNVYKHYIDSHRKEDLDIALEITKEQHPDLKRTIEEYLAGTDSNFCNMFILSKELFFEYCEFIFPILEEFEKRVDLSKKRLFISERLSGIFFANLAKNPSLKYKILPITYIDELAVVKIIINKTEDSVYPLAVTLQSLVSTKDARSKYEVTVVTEEQLSDYEKKCLNEIANGIPVSYELFKSDESIIAVAGRVLNKEKKCLIISDKVVVLNDLAKFFVTVSVDDYYVVGAPKNGFYSKCTKVADDFFVINLNRTRSKEIIDFAQEYIGLIPDYYLSVASDEADGIFDSQRSRNQILDDTSWKRFIYFNNYVPWEDPQQVLSYYWWKNAEMIKVLLPFPVCYGNQLQERLNLQQKQVNMKGTYGHVSKTRNDYNDNVEDWRKYSLLGKLIFYYKHNGLKNTVGYCFNKYIRRCIV